MTDLYSDKKPTEPGKYWWRLSEQSVPMVRTIKEIDGELHIRLLQQVDGCEWERLSIYDTGLFGPRVLTPEEGYEARKKAFEDGFIYGEARMYDKAKSWLRSETRKSMKGNDHEQETVQG